MENIARRSGHAKRFRLCVRLVAFFALAHCLFAGVISAQATDPLPDLSSYYAFTAIDTPAVAFWYSYPVRINDNGQLLISGGLFTSQGRTAIAYPGAFLTVPTGLNNRGQVVGTYLDLGGLHGFFFDGSNYRSFNCPFGGNNVRVQSINDASIILGSCHLGIGFGHAFRYDPVTDKFEQMFFPYDSYDPEPWGINNVGDIVGDYWGSGDTPFAFSLRGGNFVQLTPSTAPAGCLDRMWLSDINTRGQIVGTYPCGNYQPHSSVVGEEVPGGGTSIRGTIAVTGSATTDATGINTRGQIVGQYTNGDGVMRFFFADPVRPLPPLLPR